LSSTFVSDTNVISILALEGNHPLPIDFEKNNQKIDEQEQIMVEKLVIDQDGKSFS
jgi:hypothetical protein